MSVINSAPAFPAAISDTKSNSPAAFPFLTLMIDFLIISLSENLST